MSQAVKNKSSSCWRSSIRWYLRQTTAEDSLFSPFLLPSPTTLNAATGNRNILPLPDWHIHYSLSFTSKQSCRSAFEKVMLRNIPTRPSPRFCFRDIYLAEVSGKKSDYFHVFPCSRDSVPCCKYLKPKYFIIFLFALQLHISLFLAVLGVFPPTASHLPFCPAHPIYLTWVVNFSVNPEGLGKGIPSN